jgi:hypothetical protein
MVRCQTPVGSEFVLSVQAENQIRVANVNTQEHGHILPPSGSGKKEGRDRPKNDHQESEIIHNEQTQKCR